MKLPWVARVREMTFALPAQLLWVQDVLECMQGGLSHGHS